MSRVLSLFVVPLLAVLMSASAQETLPPLTDGNAPQTLDAPWTGYELLDVGGHEGSPFKCATFIGPFSPLIGVQSANVLRRLLPRDWMSSRSNIEPYSAGVTSEFLGAAPSHDIHSKAMARSPRAISARRE